MSETKRKPKDYTNAVIIGIVLFGILAFIGGVAMEVLKFVALIKWVFT